MSEHDRRSFLKTAAGAVPGAAIAGSLGLGGCAPETEGDGASAASRPDRTLLEAPLRAVADVTLPTDALGEEGTAEAVRGFLDWVEGFEPAAELDHPYLNDELRYGPPHPGPRWAAQLEAMELESGHRSGVSFAELPADERRDLVERALRGAGSATLPDDPAQADHVALGLLSWFYGSSQANDLCYTARVGRHLCRGIQSLPEEPSPAGDG